VHRHDSLGTQRARNLRRKDTLPERIVWRWLRDRRFGGWKFRRQYPIGPFIADVYCDPLRLIIEIDGAGHQFKAGSDIAAIVSRLPLTRRFAAPSPKGEG